MNEVAGEYAKINMACLIWVNISSMEDSAKSSIQPPPNTYALTNNLVKYETFIYIISWTKDVTFIF